MPEFSHFSYLIILFLYSDKKNLVEQKSKFSTKQKQQPFMHSNNKTAPLHQI
ncbi:hypothetical protein A943_14445 [Bacillus sp. CPSM8]|nr:hypothetical protein A943_14445 [Bacillus sp. CPSM8]